jgi:hypothetical protein
MMVIFSYSFKVVEQVVDSIVYLMAKKKREKKRARKTGHFHTTKNLRFKTITLKPFVICFTNAPFNYSTALNEWFHSLFKSCSVSTTRCRADEYGDRRRLITSSSNLVNGTVQSLSLTTASAMDTP